MWRRQDRFCSARFPALAEAEACSRNGPRPEIVADMKPRIERWAERLRTEFGRDIGIAYVESHVMMRDTYEPPANIDYYAVDCYENFDACSIDSATGRRYSMPALWTILKRHVQALNERHGGHRRMALVPPGFMAFDRKAPRDDAGITGNGALVVDRRWTPMTDRPDAAVRARAERFLTLAADPMTAMVGAFMWTSFNEGPVLLYGVRGLPKTRALFEDFGRRPLGRPLIPTAEPPTVHFIASTSVTVNSGPSIWACSSSNASRCRSVTEEATGQFQQLPPNGIFYRGPETQNLAFDYTIECAGPYGTSRATVRHKVTGAQMQ